MGRMVKAIAYIACMALVMTQSMGVMAAKLHNLRQSTKDTGCLIGGTCPTGSYLDTCSDCSTDNNGVLTCTCPNIGGSTTTTLQNSFGCSSNIGVTAGGQLVCGFVAGNYGLSCKECSMNYDDILTCSCANTQGVYNNAQLLSASTCSYAENSNGGLVCTSRTAAPTTSAPTPHPSSSVQCIWSPQTESNGESTPSSACSTKTAKQGCEFNNFCCWNSATSTCQPVPGCPNCLAYNADNCGTAPSGCCTFNTSLQQCVRACPYGKVNIEFCPHEYES
eukprot:c48441_g1_i1.p1 GENE.c48441_g1_i1~~c48441_g1_i1.p1  ORF type:complete len:277 (-),score=18.59 c48441_g1_i1:63-893(-)